MEVCDSRTGIQWGLGQGLAEGWGSAIGRETFPFIPGCSYVSHLGVLYWVGLSRSGFCELTWDCTPRVNKVPIR